MRGVLKNILTKLYHPQLTPPVSLLKRLASAERLGQSTT